MTDGDPQHKLDRFFLLIFEFYVSNISPVGFSVSRLFEFLFFFFKVTSRFLSKPLFVFFLPKSLFRF